MRHDHMVSSQFFIIASKSLNRQIEYDLNFFLLMEYDLNTQCFALMLYNSVVGWI